MESNNYAIENIHSSSFQDISKRYDVTSILISSLLFLIGLVCLTLTYYSSNANTSLNMSLMTVGTICVVLGLFRIFWRNSENIYLPTGSSVKEGTCYFEPDELDDLNDELEQKTFSNQSNKHHIKTSGKVRLDYIISKDNRFVAAQLYRFVPYNYEAVSKIFYYKDNEAASFAHCLQLKKF